MGMKSANRMKLTVDRVGRLSPNTILWDDEVVGFGVRRQRSAEIKFVLRYRAKGQDRWYTIGRFNSHWQPATARNEAKRILGEVAAGRDPQADKMAERQEGEIFGRRTCALLRDGHGAREEAQAEYCHPIPELSR